MRSAAGFRRRCRRGFAPSSPWQVALQSAARERGPKGIHVAHVLIDGGVSRAARPDRNDAMRHPGAIAQSDLDVSRQPRSAWSMDIDLRPSTESVQAASRGQATVDLGDVHRAFRSLWLISVGRRDCPAYLIDFLYWQHDAFPAWKIARSLPQRQAAELGTSHAQDSTHPVGRHHDSGVDRSPVRTSGLSRRAVAGRPGRAGP